MLRRIMEFFGRKSIASDLDIYVDWCEAEVENEEWDILYRG